MIIFDYNFDDSKVLIGKDQATASWYWACPETWLLFEEKKLVIGDKVIANIHTDVNVGYVSLYKAKSPVVHRSNAGLRYNEYYYFIEVENGKLLLCIYENVNKEQRLKVGSTIYFSKDLHLEKVENFDWNLSPIKDAYLFVSYLRNNNLTI